MDDDVERHRHRLLEILNLLDARQRLRGDPGRRLELAGVRQRLDALLRGPSDDDESSNRHRQPK